MLRTYIDWLLDVPWSVTTADRLDPVEARRVLDEDHYDLDKVKERIVEYLAGPQAERRHEGADPLLRRPARRGQDVARPVDRARDVAQVRAHLARRRARRSGDPRPSPHLHRLDPRPHRPGAETGRVDEPGVHAGRDRQDRRPATQGDPAAALLEVLDPAQNHSFRDHYLEMPVDLSRVLFIATSNQLGTIHPALLDRMEIIQLAGYSEEEKVHIARRYLLPRQMTEHGLPADAMEITDAALRAGDLRIHARSGRPEPRAAARDASPGRSPRGSRRARRTPARRTQRSSTASRWTITWGRPGSGRRWRSGRRGPAWPPAWHGRKPAATSFSSKRPCFQAETRTSF